MATISNVLPGSRKAIPHINETSQLCHCDRDKHSRVTVIFCWKILDLNKVDKSPEHRSGGLHSIRNLDSIFLSQRSPWSCLRIYWPMEWKSRISPVSSSLCDSGNINVPQNNMVYAGLCRTSSRHCLLRSRSVHGCLVLSRARSQLNTIMVEQWQIS